LPEGQRNVIINRYQSVLPEKGFFKKIISGSKRDTSTDEYIAGLSKDKQDLNDKFLNILKKNQ